VPTASTTRETLLDAALRLLEERGPGALRIRDLAEAAEQSTMGVYTHFGSKQGLLEQLYLHGFRRLEDRLSSVPSDGQGRQELLAFALAYRAFALDNDALYGLMFERATPTSSRPTPAAWQDSRPSRCSPPASPTGAPISPTRRPTRTSSGRPCTAWSPSS
jgi:AcrR family transcriptional regulator